jgi:hypothetical protein
VKTLLCLMALSGRLAASSVEPWVAGTRPYETVSYAELNIEGLASLGTAPAEGHQGGLRLDGGLLDHWSVQGQWSRDDTMGGRDVWDAGTQVRLGESGEHVVDTALFAEAGPLLEAPGQQGFGFQTGAVLGEEFRDNSLALNLMYRSLDGFATRLGYRSPYLYWTAQLALEAELSRSAVGLSPQLSIALPGDINLQCGMHWAGNGLGPTWLLSLSYEIFPSP